MTTLPQIISMGNLERQTGMTTLGVAMVNGALAIGTTGLPHLVAPKPIFVAKSQDSAAWTSKFRGLDLTAAHWPSSIFRESEYIVSLAVIDDCDQYIHSELRRVIGRIVNRMQTITTPCQIVLLRNPFNVKDLF